ncbi:ESPR-type extended signal peptide-containing protein [Paraburkholderia phymatum]|uniref:ESPR-type extended signal peptide-containing protein n=1 Tax=Paraburkholderia phymatum TaxID=148447 RepID=UPI00317487C0
MNRVYRTVWNETTGTWAAAQENAAGRGKGSSKKSLAAVIGVVGAGLGLAASGAQAAVTNGYGSLELCPGLATGGIGSSFGYATNVNNLDCTISGSNPLSFSLNNTGDTNGSYGFSASTARVTGYQTGLLELKGAAGISMLNTVSMNSNKITDLAAGAVNASSADAVNGSQLYNLANSTANAIGGGSTVNNDGSISNPTYVVGGSTVTNVAGAITNIDARVNNISNGGGIKYFHANSTLADSSAAGVNSVAVGPAATAAYASDVAIGNNAKTAVGATNSPGAIAIGGSATAYGAYSNSIGANVAIGYGSVAGKSDASTSQGLALGTWATASNWATDAIGTGSTASGNYASAIGSQSSATGDQSTALGAFTRATGTNSSALGEGASATTTNSVALGYHSVANSATLATSGYNPGSGTLSAAAAAGEVSIGTAGGERRITNVAAGLNGTDAVNVSQLQSEDAKVNAEGAATAAALGGGSTFNTTTGAISAPSYVLNGGNTTVSNVGAAITNLDGRVTQNTTDISNITTQINNGMIGLVQQDQSTRTITVAKGTDGTLVDFTGTAGIRRLTGVANGNVNVSSVDAVNGSQLYNLANSAANAIGGGSTVNSDGSISNPTYVVGGSTVTNVAGAITNIDARMNNIITGGGIKYFHANSTLSDSTASGVDSVAIGGAATAIARNSVALGSGSTTTANLSAAGYNPGSTALSGTASAANGEVSVGSAGKERRVTNVAAGSAATDAVNVSQLRSEDAKVNAEGAATAAALGGGSTFDPTTGTISAPTYVLNDGNTTVTNVGGAITNLDGRVTQNTTDISNIQTQIDDGSIGLVQQDQSTRTITVAKGTDGTVVDFTGTAGARRLTGLLNGNMNASSTDAVNGAQLYNVSQSTAAALGGGSTFDPTTGTISTPTYVLNDGNTTVTNVGGAITNLDGRVTQNTTDISNIQTQINNGSIGLVQQDQSTRTITVAKGTDGTVVDFTGTAGARRLTGLLNGNMNASSTDAVNGAQLYNVSQSTAAALGGGSTFDPTTGTISAPTYVLNDGNTTVSNVGAAITNLDGRVTNIDNAVTNIVNGGGIKYFHANSTLADSSATGRDAVAIGGAATAGAASAVAVGGQSTATGSNSVAVGGQSTAAGSNSTALGNASTATATDSVALGSGSIASRDNTVSVGSAGNERQITNVAAGTAGTDVVNVNQLNAAIQNVTNLANNAVDPMFTADGDRDTEAAAASGTHATAMGPTAIASGSQSIATGFNAKAAGDGSVATGANAAASGPTATAIGTNATASGSNAVALGAGSVADQDNTVSVGSASQQRRITNVAAGTAPGDAVNFGQVNDMLSQMGNQAVQAANAYTDQQFSKMNNKMNSLGAAAMAATSLIPNARAEGNFQMSAAAGTYGGAAAIAVGANYWVSDRVLLNAHVTRATGNGASTGASIGATIGF